MTVPPSDIRLTMHCGSSHWSLPARCALPTGHGPDYHAGWTGKSGTPGRVYVRYWAETGVTEQLIAGVWQPTGIPGPRPEELLAELDRLRAENEQLAEDAARDVARERERAGRCERDAVEARALVHAASTVKCWTNEDGRRFVFAEDLAFALGYTTTTAKES